MGLPVAVTPISVRATPELKAPPLGQTFRVLVYASPFLAVAVLNLFARPELDPMLRLVASVVCFIAFLPAVFHIRDQKTGLPFMPLYALLFSCYYGIPVFLDYEFSLPAYDISLTDSSVTDAMLVILLGLVCLLVGFYLPTDRFLRNIPRMRRGLDESSGLQMGWILVGIGILYVQVRYYIPIRFAAIGQIVQQIGSLGLALLFYYFLLGRIRGFQKVVLLVLIPVMAMVDIAQGGIYPVQQHLLPLVGTYWIVRRKLLWKTMLVVALLMVPFSGVKAEFRRLVFGTDMGVVDRSRLFGQLVIDGFRNQEDFYSYSFQITMARLNMTTTLVAVRALTPSVIPYWGGTSYATLYWMAIPRALYPDKPVKSLGQDFPHRYGLLGKFDTMTSYNFPQLVEFYANFGEWGVVFGMLIIGLVQRLLYYCFTAPDADPGVSLFATIILVRLCSIDSDFSLVYGGLFLNVIGVVVILRVLHARRVHLPLDIFRFRW
jgi:hypothetical protein